jgi:beta-N-acetylhexosaminidase
VPSSVRRDIGQLLIGSLPGTTIPAEMRSLAREFGLGGVIFFSRNIEAPEQVAELSYDVQSLATELPLWVSVDQEGGRVARLKAPFTVWPPMATLGRSGDETLASRFAAALAAELRAVGITLDYAPVLDIHTNPKNPIIGDRALAESADQVARLGAAIVRGLQETGLRPAASISRARRHVGRLAPGAAARRASARPDPRVECVPFRAAIAADVAFIMTAHVLVPSLDEERPPRCLRASSARSCARSSDIRA